jgi:hypothetical protein
LLIILASKRLQFIGRKEESSSNRTVLLPSWIGEEELFTNEQHQRAEKENRLQYEDMKIASRACRTAGT